jgi:hypothetical protein
MTNLTEGSEDLGPSQNGGRTPFPDSQDAKKSAEIVHGSLEASPFPGCNSNQVFVSASRSVPLFQEEAIFTNGWHHDDDSNQSFEFLPPSTTPEVQKSAKRKLSMDQDGTSSASKRKMSIASSLLQDGKHGLVDGRWICGQCGRGLSSASSLDQHLSSVHVEPMLPCSHCPMMFKRRDHVRNHTKRVHTCTKICPKCGAQFIGREKYAEHMKSVHKIKVSFKPIRSHNKVGDKSTPMKASTPILKQAPTTPSSPSLVISERTKREVKFSKNGKRLGRPPNSPNKPRGPGGVQHKSPKLKEDSTDMPPPTKQLAHECNYCHRRFHNTNKLLQHKYNMHIEEMVHHLCNFCHRYFKGVSALNDHKDHHHRAILGPELCVVKCSYCSGAFQDQETLEEHVSFYHLEEECLICGSLFLGEGEVVEHIIDVHPPETTAYGHQCRICGGLYRQRHHFLTHFRRRHFYYWNFISMPSQVFQCPHCNHHVDSWSSLHEHVINEHRSYGIFYMEPEYVAVFDPYAPDELVLLSCAICDTHFHDQESLDRHIIDHEPFASRTRPLPMTNVKFDIENIEYAAVLAVKSSHGQDNDETIKSPPVIKKTEGLRNRKKVKDKKVLSPKTPTLTTKAKKASPKVAPAPEPPVKLVRSQVRKIIIPKKRTLMKRAMMEERRKQLGLSKPAPRSKRMPASEEKVAIIGPTDRRTLRRQSRPEPTSQLPRRRLSSMSSSSTTNTTPTSKPQRRTSSRDDEDTPLMIKPRVLVKRDRQTKPEPPPPVAATMPEPPPPDAATKPEPPPPDAATKPEPPPPVAAAAAATPVKRRFIYRDEFDIFDDSDEEVMPTPKRRGGLKDDKPASSSSEEESDEDDKVTVQAAQVKRVAHKDASGEDDVAAEEREEGEGDSGEDGSGEDQDASGEEEEESSEEEEEEEEEEDEKKTKPHCYDPDSDDELLRMSPKPTLRRLRRRVVERFTAMARPGGMNTGLKKVIGPRRFQQQEQASSDDDSSSEDSDEESDEDEGSEETNVDEDSNSVQDEQVNGHGNNEGILNGHEEDDSTRSSLSSKDIVIVDVTNILKKPVIEPIIVTDDDKRLEEANLGQVVSDAIKESVVVDEPQVVLEANGTILAPVQVVSDAEDLVPQVVSDANMITKEPVVQVSVDYEPQKIVAAIENEPIKNGNNGDLSEPEAPKIVPNSQEVAVPNDKVDDAVQEPITIASLTEMVLGL